MSKERFGVKGDSHTFQLLKISYVYRKARAPLVAQLVKKLPAMWETWVRSLGWEDPLGEGMTTYSGILAWRSPWTEEGRGGLVGYSPWGRKSWTQLSN